MALIHGRPSPPPSSTCCAYRFDGVRVVLARVLGTALGEGATLTGGAAGHEPTVPAVVRTKAG